MPNVPNWLRQFLRNSCNINNKVALEIIQNLENDQAISDDTWNSFCEELKNEIKSPNADPEKIFNEVCTRYSPKGPQACIPTKIKTLNRVVSQETFVIHFLAKRGFNTANPEIAVEGFDRGTLDQQRKILRDSTLAAEGKPVWAFFPEHESEECQEDIDPIDHPKVDGQSEKLYNVLGLQCTVPSNINLVNMRYPTNKPKNKRVPLSVSAGLTRCFRPSNSKKPKYGYTFNIDTGEKGFPEIIHENIDANCISKPVRRIIYARTD